MAVVAVAGTTSWGATLAWLLARNGHDVEIIARTPAEADAINASRRVARATSLELPTNVRAVSFPARLDHAQALVLVVPSQTVRENARALRETLPAGLPLVHATKGLERGTGKRVSQMLAEELPQLTPDAVCALSGPNLAEEIRRGLPAATVIAGATAANVALAQRLFHGGAFRVYASDDLPGVELAGSLKNVVALTAGIAEGLGLGDNAKAGIITRGLAEMTRLGIALGADAMTFSGLAGVGDVIATSYSPLSRNRRTGEAIGQGTSVTDAVRGAGGVVEGVDATAGACLLADRTGIDMPIARGLREILFEGATVQTLIARLLEREPTREVR